MNPGQNPVCPAGGFSVCKGLQVTEEIRESFTASDADIVVLDRKNAPANQIVQVVQVVLRVIFRPLATQWELGTF